MGKRRRESESGVLTFDRFFFTLFSTILFPTVARADGETAAATLGNGEYIVNLNFYRATAPAALATGKSAIANYTNDNVMQINERALLTKTDENWSIKLQFFSFSIYTRIAVMDPTIVSNLTAIPAMPNDRGYLSEGTSYSSGGSDNAKYLADTQFKVTGEDSFLDVGYMEITIPVADFDPDLPLAFQYTSSPTTTSAPVKAYININSVIDLSKYNTDAESWVPSWTNWSRHVITGSESASAAAATNTYANTAAYKKPLNEAFASIASVVNNSENNSNLNLQAIFNVNDSGDGGIVLSVDRAASRNSKTSNQTNYWKDWVDTTWNSIYTSDASQKKVTLDFDRDALIYGIPLSVLVLSNKTQSATTGNYIIQYLTARLSINPGKVEYLSQTAADGALVLKYQAGDIPEDSVFTAEKYTAGDSESIPYATPELLGGAASLSLGGNAYRCYTFSLKKDGVEVAVKNAVSIEFHPPDGWNVSNLNMTLYMSTGTRETDGVLAGKYASLDTIHNIVYLNIMPNKTLSSFGTIVFVQPAVKLNLSESITEPGIYRVSMALMHYNLNQASMANPTLYEHIGYIEMDDSLNKTLYMRFIPLDALSMDNYMLSIFYNSTSYGKVYSEILDYYTQPEIFSSREVGDGGASAALGLHYPEIVALPLRGEVPGFEVVVPVMNSMAGYQVDDETGAKAVRVYYTKIDKVDSNPYAGYNVSIIEVKLEEAQKLLATLADGEAKNALEAAIATAQSVTNDAGSDAVKAARDALALAITNAKSGVVKVKTAREKLAEAISRIGELIGDAAENNEYEETSLAALTGALAEAKAVLGEADASDNALTAALEALTLAEAALVKSADITKYPREAGTYDVPVKLVAIGTESPSAANGAIDSATLTLTGDSPATGRLTLVFKELPYNGGRILFTAPAGANPAYTYTGVVYDTVTEGEATTTIYYPASATFDVTLGEAAIPITFEIPNSPLVDDTSADVIIDWSVFDLGGNQPAVNKVALTTALGLAKTESAKTDAYTADSLAILNANIAAGDALLSQTYASQAMVDARAAAINAARAALVTAAVDRTALTQAITRAGELDADDYTTETWGALQSALTAARDVAGSTAATQAQVGEAASALQNALTGLQAKPADKLALAAKLEEAETAIAAGSTGYTQASWEALTAAYSAAQTVNADPSATSAEVGSALAALNAALNGLKIDITSLESALAEASKYLEGGANYVEGKFEPASLAALTAAKASAATAVLADELTTEQSSALTALLTKAIDALIEAAELTERPAKEYPLAGKTALWNYTNPSNPSMGNGAIDHAQSKLVVDAAGNARLHLFFGPLQASLGTIEFTGYLKDLYVATNIESGYAGLTYDTTLATVESDWGDSHDDFWREGWAPYPKELSIPVTVGENEVIVEVFVPVMEHIATGTGTQLARLRIDWTDFVPSPELADVTELNAAIAAAPVSAEGANTEESEAALTASVAAGQFLIDNNAALTVTSAMADARAEAITAAIAALIETGSTKPGGDPEPPDEPELPIDSVAPTVTSEVADGKAAASVTEDAVKAAVSAAAGIEEGGEEPSEPVKVGEIKLTVPPPQQAETPVTAVEVTIPAAAIAVIGQAEAAIVVESSVGTVKLPAAVVTQLNSEAQPPEAGGGTTGEAVTVGIENVAAAVANATLANVTDAAKTGKIGDAPAVFELNVAVGATPTHTFTAAVEVTLPYTPPEGASTSTGKFVVAYIADDGTVEVIAAAASYENGKVTFTTTHFSKYVISFIETPEQDGGDDGNTEDNTGDNTGNNNNNNSDTAQNASYNVSVALWHNDRNQASMGNIAFADGTGTSFTNIQKVDGKDAEVVVPTSLAIVNALNGVYKLQSVTHPVNIALTADQGYISALQELEYKKNGVWTPVRVLKRELCTPNPEQAPGAQPFQYIRAFEMDLPDMNTQFIEVRVKVPYTPMDAVLNTEASDGWINAKVRIFWDTLTEIPGGGRLEFDTGEAPAVTSSAYEEGSVEFDIRDDATGIRAEAAPGVLSEGAELTVEAITAESESETAKASYAKAQTALDGVSTKFKLFDITIYDADGAETQPNGRLTLRFPIPEGFDAAKTALYRINDDATATLIKGKVENGEYVAAVTHLSLYALVELAEDAVAADEAEENDGFADAASPEVTVGAENVPLSGDAEIAEGDVLLSDFTPPQTGDESLTAYAAVFGLSLAAMGLSVTVKKRRKNTDA